jgi:sulfide:quinone oxidoreductase
VLILGAGFGGLEVATLLSEGSGGEIEVTLIDKGEGFVFGFSKLELMFGRAGVEEVRMPYGGLDKPGVRWVRETITAIDPEARRVTTDGGSYEGDAIVIALGADYDFDATPGLAEAGNEFYSVAGAERLAGILPTFARGRAVIGVCGAPFKCPPAPSECALLLDDELRARGVRGQCEISFVIPFAKPVPPSPETSAALEAEFAERGIELIAGRRVAALDGERAVVVLDDDAELPYDLFLGVPRHRAPDVVIASGLTEDGFVPVDPATLRTGIPGVYAVGDVATAGVPKAGVFAEGAGRVVAQALLAEFHGAGPPGRHLGQGTCYIEFGHGRVASVDIDFLSGPERSGTFNPPSADLVAEKEEFGSSRRARWFGA